MFAMIENRGVADVRSFTKLGLSTARGSADKIGQFGSGAKHGILTLIRAGLNPYIYCGKTKLQFFSQPNKMQDTTYNDMFVKVDNAKPVELSYCLEFGELDWKDVSMGLREIVSNAIDNAESQGEFTVKIVEQPRAKDGFTRVFIPLNADVQKFVNTLSDRFLQFDGDNIEKKILAKKEDGQAKIYRKGVFVRQMDSWNEKSLFDYNFGEELLIDECRNANDWDCKRQIATAISTDKKLVRNMFLRFISGTSHDRLEDVLDEYSLKGNDEWKVIWNEIAGDNAVILLTANASLGEFLVKKGFKPYLIPTGWYKAMSKVGIRCGVDCLSKIENEGYAILEPTERACEIRDELWGWLSDLELTAKKDKPEIQCFSMVIQNGNNTLFGYREGNTIFINVDFVDNKQTYLEEIAHYVTDACDGTREFQEFAFQIATRMGELIFS